ncbi:dihydrofolate reductase family protein [Advenella mimigardefordensis]|uniref:Putative 5-amino-6-(5-phosphoribosylamino)uracil reductase n=1 Tax=Advenella mimigardefordensis (strain DSM 17166 / LMG 22922 / DPN7) TaxID=1247726 RepID=W0PF00_ADVMD|nr:dihydrofolate reductase family protein [Advenella mimigardefordensis]AHG64127.1 putative 5-amino-6-(5-phosphoribosylamino)uracil reductase [Advenella mimigardefordensis DPN7]
MRPKIICHMIGSIDGRLLSNRWTPLPEGTDTGTVLKVYEEAAKRLGGQGWIVGRKTMADMVRGEKQPQNVTGTLTQRVPYIGKRQGRALAVAVDPSGKLHYGTDHLGSEHVVAILSEHVSDDYLAQLRKDGVSYLFAGADGRNLNLAMQTMASTFGVETILLEGGGATNGAFLKADLIDEISLLVYPGIDGLAGVPSIFQYYGNQGDERPAAGRSLRLLSVETLSAGIVWLRYTIDHSGRSQ